MATQVVYLPSDGGLPILSENFVTEDIAIKSLELQPWQVEGLVLTPAETVTFLKILPLGSLQFGDR
ncbi:MAG: hypothetical protein HC890_15030 [Chloroflexaceae bacterium]|nr:hypothetical protein [Chloroflexaceae bacterium]